MMTGLYPAGHGVHENGRSLSTDHAVLAERLQRSGYHTAAFVSSFVLARRFGLARGFDLYDDDLPAGRSERTARETTDAAIARLDQQSSPFFLWVHYYDPHSPYVPPEPFRTRYAKTPYLGEVAAMDEQLGRLVQAFEARARLQGSLDAVAIVADHGEGLGDHGEAQHGNLLYQSTMHVPLLLVGPGIVRGVTDIAVSTRRIYHTVLDWAGVDPAHSLRAAAPDAVLGEAMKPFLDYGWQPQVMTIANGFKGILAGKLEAYDLDADPGEAHDLGSAADVPMQARQALEEYPVPTPEAARAPAALDEEARRRLASLGYVGATVAPVVRKGAPRPVDMTRLFGVLDRASGLFVAEQYGQSIPLFEEILATDSFNLDAALRLATAHSALGHDRQAVEMFEKARAIAPSSQDVRMYLGLHYARGAQWERAVPLLEPIVAATPDRLPAVEALAAIRERQGRIAEAIDLRQKIHGMRQPTAAEVVHLGQLAMGVQRTGLAIESFERARQLQAGAFKNDLELGVLYLAAGRLQDAKVALDRVPASGPEYPMALFKRAQVSVLLHEPDRAARIDLARRKADPTTRELIARERLFQEGR
jgi:tetratricopeptide (TPR) repeat protein